MRNILIIIGSILLTITAQAQLEVCKDADTLKVTGTAPYQWYELAVSGYGSCYVNNKRTCDTSSKCLWDLNVAKCYPINEAKPNGCENLSEYDCAFSQHLGCVFYDAGCHLDATYTHSVRGTSDTLVISENTSQYLVVDAANLRLELDIATVPSCSMVTSTNNMLELTSVLFPNPLTTEKLNIQLNKNYSDISGKVIDMNGLEVYSISNTSGNELNIPTENWATGNYFISLTIDGQQIVYKVIKEN